MRALRFAIGAVLALALLILGVAALTPAPAAAQSVRAAAVHPYAGHVADAARRFGIPEAWIWAVMHVESRGNRRAVSRAGAMGVMQIMPATWALLRARHGLGADPFDVRDNIMAGAAYLRAMHDRYGNAAAMLAAYNAGPGRYDQYLRGRPLPAETRAYLAQLTPITGGAGDVQLAAATPPADPLAWRRSALFIRTDAVDRDAPAAQPEGIRGDTADAAPAPPNPLFVRRDSAARPQ